MSTSSFSMLISGTVQCLVGTVATATAARRDILRTGSVNGYGRLTTADEALRRALRHQFDGEAPDRSLIVERLGWSPAQRLEANAAFVRFYLRAQPDGPLLRE